MGFLVVQKKVTQETLVSVVVLVTLQLRVCIDIELQDNLRQSSGSIELKEPWLPW